MDLEKILKEKCENELRAPLVDFEGCVLPKSFERFLNEIKNMEVRDDDVWVTSFPKSGTTWCQEMVWLIANNLNYEAANESLFVRYPFLEYTALVDFNTYSQKHPDYKCPSQLLDSVKYVINLKGRRFIKTHLPWNLLPIQIQNGTKKPKIIHVIRNPKDILVSYYHHSTLLQGFTGTLEEFFQLFMADKGEDQRIIKVLKKYSSTRLLVDHCPYFDNVFSYWAQRHLDNVLLIKYEDMQKDLTDVIKTVAQFLNRSVPNEEMEKLLKHLSFNEMKNNTAVNCEIFVETLKEMKVMTVLDKKFIRSGKSGSYKEELSPEMIAQMDEWIQTNCKKTGIDFS